MKGGKSLRIRSTGPIAAGRHLGYKSLAQIPACRNRPVSLYVRRQNMRQSLLRPLLAVLALSLPACVPWPNQAHTRPSMQGSLSEGGVPIPGAEVFVGKFAGTNTPCQEVGERVPVSPTDGSFSVAPESERQLFLSVLNPPRYTGKITAICIRHPSRGVLIGALVQMFVDKPLSVKVSCDLSRAGVGFGLGNAQTSSPIGQAQVCIATR